MVCNCFHTATVTLTSCDRNLMVLKAVNAYYLADYRKFANQWLQTQVPQVCLFSLKRGRQFTIHPRNLSSDCVDPEPIVTGHLLPPVDIFSPLLFYCMPTSLWKSRLFYRTLFPAIDSGKVLYNPSRTISQWDKDKYDQQVFFKFLVSTHIPFK